MTETQVEPSASVRLPEHEREGTGGSTGPHVNTDENLPGLLFVRVTERKIHKNRLHIDLRPDDQQHEVARLTALGAQLVDVGQSDSAWTVLADPEGNEFCVLRQL